MHLLCSEIQSLSEDLVIFPFVSAVLFFKTVWGKSEACKFGVYAIMWRNLHVKAILKSVVIMTRLRPASATHSNVRMNARRRSRSYDQLVCSRLLEISFWKRVWTQHLINWNLWRFGYFSFGICHIFKTVCGKPVKEFACESQLVLSRLSYDSLTSSWCNPHATTLGVHHVRPACVFTHVQDPPTFLPSLITFLSLARDNFRWDVSRFARRVVSIRVRSTRSANISSGETSEPLS